MYTEASAASPAPAPRSRRGREPPGLVPGSGSALWPLLPPLGGRRGSPGGAEPVFCYRERRRRRGRARRDPPAAPQGEGAGGDKGACSAETVEPPGKAEPGEEPGLKVDCGGTAAPGPCPGRASAAGSAGAPQVPVRGRLVWYLGAAGSCELR